MDDKVIKLLNIKLKKYVNEVKEKNLDDISINNISSVYSICGKIDVIKEIIGDLALLDIE